MALRIGDGKTGTMFGRQALIVLILVTKSWSRRLWVVDIVGSDRNHDGRTHGIHLVNWTGKTENRKLSNQMIRIAAAKRWVILDMAIPWPC